MNNNAFRKYLIEVGQYPLLTPEEEIDLATRYQAGDQTAREKLILSNLRLVVSIAKNYHNTHLSIADLVSEGNLGLVTAIEKFDPSLGYRFSTCATPWIKQAIGKAITDKGRNIRIPAHVYQQLSKYRVALENIEADGRKATDAEIAKVMGVEIDKVKALKRHLYDTISIETPLGADSDETLGDVISDEHTETPYEHTEKVLMQDRIAKVVAQLKPRAQEIVRLRYGLMPDGVERTLEEIGEMLDLTRERVRQIEKQALSEMRLIWDRVR